MQTKKYANAAAEPQWRHIWRILVIHSAKDLFKYKSFFLLIFVLMLADRMLKKVIDVDRGSLHLPQFGRFTAESAAYVFQQMPQDIWRLLTDARTFLILAGLFFLKQLISLWPSSDMRRMHRRERGSFGLLQSLAAIRWEQVLWDAVAVSTVCGLFALWTGSGFAAARWGWQANQNTAWLLGLAGYTALFTPLVMAGFSFSSKLAVISNRAFGRKIALYLRLFYAGPILWPAWLFFSFRIAVEMIFVVLIPLIVLLFVDPFWLRVPAATLIATPVYSYLKMASFKFFLAVYRPFPMVREEFAAYYGDVYKQ